MRRFVFLFLLIEFFCSCEKTFFPQQETYTSYKLNSGLGVDSTIIKTTSPYKDSLDKKMNVVIGYCQTELIKQQPEGSLGNFVCEAIIKEASSITKTKIDFSVVNIGGIRIASIPKGNITLGKVYELMPFDNQLVIQTISGTVVQQLCNLIIKNGGWPVSGIRMELGNGVAKNISINGKTLDTTATYNMLISDYLANGGDDCVMLKNIPQKNLNLLMRDAIINYIEKQTALDNNLNATTDGRIKLTE